jgi:hypothetical protein
VVSKTGKRSRTTIGPSLRTEVVLTPKFCESVVGLGAGGV